MEARQSAQRWFALRVKSRREKVVAAAVHQKGFEEFLPLYLSHQRWSDRLQTVALPLFPGYVFCRLDPEHRLPLLTIPGVLNFVEVGRIPVPIDDAEIEAIQIAVRSQLRTEPCPFVEGGNRVRLESGPLTGLEGVLIRTHYPQSQFVVALTALRRSISIEIQDHWAGSIVPPTSDTKHIVV
jgi:transcription antitermination factor NusG